VVPWRASNQVRGRMQPRVWRLMHLRRGDLGRVRHQVLVRGNDRADQGRTGIERQHPMLLARSQKCLAQRLIARERLGSRRDLGLRFTTYEQQHANEMSHGVLLQTAHGSNLGACAIPRRVEARKVNLGVTAAARFGHGRAQRGMRGHIIPISRSSFFSEASMSADTERFARARWYESSAITTS